MSGSACPISWQARRKPPQSEAEGPIAPEIALDKPYPRRLLFDDLVGGGIDEIDMLPFQRPGARKDDKKYRGGKRGPEQDPFARYDF